MTVEQENFSQSFYNLKMALIVTQRKINILIKSFFESIYNIKERMNKVAIFIFIMTILLHSGNDLFWQGTGNFSQSNLTQIWNYINKNFKSSWKKSSVIKANDTTLVNFTNGFSDQLNFLWDPAWNVVVAFNTNGFNTNDSFYDSIHYGYAFRSHWMWYNGYKMDDGYNVSFVIWKDYNCITWQTYNYNAHTRNYYPTTFNNSTATAIKTAIGSLYNSLDLNEVWLAGKAYADILASDNGVQGALGQDTAYTIIMSQSYFIAYFARFCAKDYLINYQKVGAKPHKWGEAFVIQMR